MNDIYFYINFCLSFSIHTSVSTTEEFRSIDGVVVEWTDLSSTDDFSICEALPVEVSSVEVIVGIGDFEEIPEFSAGTSFVGGIWVDEGLNGLRGFVAELDISNTFGR